jgi:hypothetical protein
LMLFTNALFAFTGGVTISITGSSYSCKLSWIDNKFLVLLTAVTVPPPDGAIHAIFGDAAVGGEPAHRQRHTPRHHKIWQHDAGGDGDRFRASLPLRVALHFVEGDH